MIHVIEKRETGKALRQSVVGSRYAFFFLLSFGASPMACGGSQARGLIGAVAASLHQSHSNMGSELHLCPTPQLMATQDP